MRFFAVRLSVLLAGVLTAQLALAPLAAQELKGPLSPAESLKHFRLSPGLKIELAAAEPDVVDPVEIRFDERGRMWVVEMGDYPFGPAEGNEPQSRIRILEDRDGDGHFERSAIFADRLLFATGLQPWRGGAIVTLAGEVAFFKDTDGDGRADQRETWFRGFAQENSQLRANHPRFALDGFVYVANGLRGGSVVDARHPDKPPVPLNNLDFRFHPTTGKFEALTGVGQFGLTFDDYGNRFICSNRNPLMHVVLEDRFLKRNPNAAIPELRHDVAKAAEQSRLFALSRAWTTSNLHAGQFTAACGVLMYRGDALPPRYYGAGFTCDPTGNLVHCELLQPEGATFTSLPEREGAEFLASPDEWFRPVNCELGPDGALYVVDMYRAVIEHPDFVPDELKRRPDQMLGNDRGRIYRITSESGEARRRVKSLEGASNTQLAEYLADTNGWQRDTAHRLLLERHDASARGAIQQVVDRSAAAPGRVAALWALHGLDGLTDEQIKRWLHDQDPRVREQAVAVCEGHLADNTALRSAIRRMADDPDARVRFLVALILAPAEESDVESLARIVLQGSGDVWTRRAVALSASGRAIDVLLSIFALRDDAPAGDELEQERRVLEDLAGTIGASEIGKQQEFCRRLLARYRDESEFWAKTNVLRAWLQSAARSGRDTSALMAGADESLQRSLFEVFLSVAERAQDLQLSDSHRIQALDLLAFYPDPSAVIDKLALEEPAQEVRMKAINIVARRANIGFWKRLLEQFPTSSPAVRRAILEGSLANNERVAALLDEITAQRIRVSELDPLTVSRLVQHGNPQIRERANQLLADSIPADRQKVLAEYQAALAMPGDPQKGRQIFSKICANCHRIDNLGVDVAPDISDSRVKTAPQLLTDILQPNRAIDNNYISYSVVTTDGQSLVGVLSAETSTSVSLKMAEGKTVTLLRGEIEELRSLGVSLMPEGLEKDIPVSAMADLISFIKNWRYLDGRTPVAP